MLKQFFVLVFSICALQATQAQGIEFFHGTYDEAVKEANAQGKLIFMDAFTSWCGPCKMMSAQTFTDAKVGEFFNKNFICMKVDMEKGEGPTLANKFSVTAYPTLLFISPEGKLVHKGLGFQTADPFIALAETALKSYDKSGDYKKKYDAGDRTPDNLKKYAAALMQSRQDYLKIANEYISTQKDMTTPDNLQFIFDFANYSDSQIYDLLIKNKGAIELLKTKDAVATKIEQAAKNTVQRAIEFKNEELLKEAKTKIDDCGNPATCEKFRLESDMYFYLQSGNTAKYVEATNAYVKKIVKNNDTKLYELSRQFLMNVNDKKGLKYAEGWAKKALKLGNRYEYAHTYAELLAKNGKTSAAIKAAEKAVALATQQNVNPTVTQELLTRLHQK